MNINLREMRIAANMTQEQLSKASGVSRQAISYIEQGKADPCIPTMNALAGALGMELQISFVPAV